MEAAGGICTCPLLEAALAAKRFPNGGIQERGLSTVIMYHSDIDSRRTEKLKQQQAIQEAYQYASRPIWPNPSSCPG